MPTQIISPQRTTKTKGWALLPTLCLVFFLSAIGAKSFAADDSFESDASWQQPSRQTLNGFLRQSLIRLGTPPTKIEQAETELASALEANVADPLSAFVTTSRQYSPIVEQLVELTSTDLQAAAARVIPDHPAHINLATLPDAMQMSVRTWLGRELVRARLYDEALPVLKEVNTAYSTDPAATLFFRGACFHALLQKKEALVDLQRLLENEKECPIRFTRTAQLMVADIAPLKEDSLDEISRLMTDVTRRLDLGRADENVQDQEQKIIDKLSKLIEKIEEQQQQQQQQQQSGQGQGQGNSQGGQSAPMNESQAAGGNGTGDVDRKNIEDRDGWGKLPPAERTEALQQISRDLPTHYREAIEAYFRKLATDGS